ncbi:hypothetical protein EII22_08800 [Coriobacteriales bacterium OH1046]|nr:hypothetical protein EII22_08800 [Coriobacteriales bacterium OH1046]
MNIFDSHIAAGQQLGKREREQYYTALIEFLAYGIEPKVGGAALAVITAIRPSLDESRSRRLAGLASGESRRMNTSGTNAGTNDEQTRDSAANKTGENGRTKSKSKSKGKEEKTYDLAGGMASALPCLAAPAGGSSVFIDLDDKPHRTALGSIIGSYAHVGGVDPTGFVSKLRGICPGGCGGDPDRADECYGLVMRALGKYDPDKGRGPWPLVKTILEQERGTG